MTLTKPSGEPEIARLTAERDAWQARANRAEAALRDAIAELVECRSFISVETRHYPTVTAINAKVDEYQAVLDLRHPSPAQEHS